FMRIDLTRAPLDKGRIRRPVYFEKWTDHYNNAAAQLIADAYEGHTDSRINDQYRSVAGARKFLYNIVQYPGCGAFYRPASYAARAASRSPASSPITSATLRRSVSALKSAAPASATNSSVNP